MAKPVATTGKATRGTKTLVEVFKTQLDATPDRYRRDAGLEALSKLSGIVKALPKFKEPAAKAGTRKAAVSASGKKLGRPAQKAAQPALANGALYEA